MSCCRRNCWKVLSDYWWAVRPKVSSFRETSRVSPLCRVPFRREGLPSGAPEFRDFETGDAPIRFWHQFPVHLLVSDAHLLRMHSAASWPQQLEYDGPLPADRDQQVRRDNQSGWFPLLHISRRRPIQGTDARLSRTVNGSVGAGSGGCVPPLDGDAFREQHCYFLHRQRRAMTAIEIRRMGRRSVATSNSATAAVTSNHQGQLLS